MNQTNRIVFISLVLLLVTSYLSLFMNLGVQEMQVWDESSYALNAQEMVERGTPMRMYLLGKPELYNTKPPLAIWCMAASIQLFGFSEWAVRLPVALFALMAVGLLFLFTYHYTRHALLSLLPPLILLSSTGYVGEHLARTADTDAILASWMLLYVLCLYAYTKVKDAHKQRRWLLLTCFGITMACFTKGIAGLTALPALIAWLLIEKKLITTLKQPALYWGIGFFILVVPGYYVLRNYLTPGYIDTVLHYEFLGRLQRQEFLNPEPRGFFFYLTSMVTDDRFHTWIWLLAPAAVYWWFIPNDGLRNVGRYATLALAGVLFSLGISSTKLFWYDAPLYPLMSLVIGLSIADLAQRARSYAPVWVFACFAVIPFQLIWARNSNPPQRMNLRDALYHVRNNMQVHDTLHIVEVDFNFSLHFYAKADSLKGGITRIVTPDDVSLRPGVTFLTCKYAREVDMHNRFVCDTLFRFNSSAYYRIREVKSQP